MSDLVWEQKEHPGASGNFQFSYTAMPEVGITVVIYYACGAFWIDLNADGCEECEQGAGTIEAAKSYGNRMYGDFIRERDGDA